MLLLREWRIREAEWASLSCRNTDRLANREFETLEGLFAPSEPVNPTLIDLVLTKRDKLKGEDQGA